MDVEDAFTEEAISKFDTNVADETEVELKDIIRRIYTNNDLAPPNDDDVNVAALCFVAGRTYQADQVDVNSFPIVMNLPMVQEFLEFLVAKGAT